MAHTQTNNRNYETCLANRIPSVKVAAELAGTILKVVIDLRGDAVLTECGSAEIDTNGLGQLIVSANVLRGGYLHRETIRVRTSDEFANSDVAEINYVQRALEVLAAM
jgi:hypothetical protein